MQFLTRFFGINEKQWGSRKDLFEEGVSSIQKKRNVNVIKLDIFSPVAYVAIDYKSITEASLIQAKHYLLSEDKSVLRTVRPGVELYEYYRQQILLEGNARI